MEVSLITDNTGRLRSGGNVTVAGSSGPMAYEGPPAKRVRRDESMDVDIQTPLQFADNDFVPGTLDEVKSYMTTLVAGRSYYMYRRPAGHTYVSLLSPKDWNDRPPHDFITAIRYEGNFVWTKVDD
ncbi:uncharacterized protein LOC106671946 isoform X2 [Cimex lectularius]|uniref:Uncharacterized protein n=1 Tax=Cimex lectularius TaxID=79782 RepID=A0A8I6S7T2_CIMLE|nr:uncharacterized protein LOC106671946 isoform X2 [Cimex lectularius]